MEIQSFNLFPKIFWATTIESNLKDLEEECYEIKNIEKGVSKSNKGGKSSYQSPAFGPLDIEDKPNLNKLLLKIVNCSTFIHQSSRTGDLSLANFWININKNGGSNNIHIHPGSLYSGVYYIKIPTDKQNAGGFIFHREFSEIFHNSEAYMGKYKKGYKETPADFKASEITPLEKTLIIFPSWFPHSVGVNQTDEDRISIAFNITLLK